MSFVSLYLRQARAKMLVPCALGAAVLFPFSGEASLNLVQDGSFEQQVASSPFQTIYAGDSFGGWTVSSGSIDLINGYWNAANGNQSVDLAGDSSGAIQQGLSVAAGTYHLAFDLSGNSDGPPQLKTVRVTFGGQSQDFTFLASGSNGNMNWALQTWDVTVGGGSTLLKFEDISGPPGFYGMALDNISLVAVPETSTMVAGALLGLPFAASMLRFTFRKRAR